MTRFLLFILIAASSTAGAIVIRDDVYESKYRIPASEFPALVDIPGEGHPPAALPLEGIFGNGDSGGPALIQVDDQWLLAGIAAWKVVQGDIRTARPGLYGQTNCNVRLSHYIEWIESVISVQSQDDGADG
jgi:hypothetical protein